MTRRFWSNVDKTSSPGGCWLWTGNVSTSGYGRYGKRAEYVHRLVAAAHLGPCPDGHEVCHSCDVKTCCNPEHLRYGTRSDNVRDQVERGQHYSPFTAQERARHGFAPGGPCQPGGGLQW